MSFVRGLSEARVKVFDTTHWHNLLYRYPGAISDKIVYRNVVKVPEPPPLTAIFIEPTLKWCIR